MRGVQQHPPLVHLRVPTVSHSGLSEMSVQSVVKRDWRCCEEGMDALPGRPGLWTLVIRDHETGGANPGKHVVRKEVCKCIVCSWLIGVGDAAGRRMVVEGSGEMQRAVT